MLIYPPLVINCSGTELARELRKMNPAVCKCVNLSPDLARNWVTGSMTTVYEKQDPVKKNLTVETSTGVQCLLHIWLVMSNASSTPVALSLLA